MAKDQHFFPYLPDYMSWEEFNQNLFLSYGEQNIIDSTEPDWRNTARGLQQSSTFSPYGIPNPDSYDHWQQWARDFVTVLNGPSH